MAVNKRRMRNQKPGLNPAELAYLSDEDIDLEGSFRFTLWCYRTGQDALGGDPKPDELWNKHKDEFLPKFIQGNPGHRPLPWWQWDAPRWKDPFEGTYFHDTLPEPRLRIGGVGTPRYEVFAYAPSFFKGIPDSWVSEDEVLYGNGRMKDIHGKKIGDHNEGDFKGVAIDPDDLPLYESETNYLLRHNLLSPQEKKYVARHPELMEPGVVTVE